jgi:hypothetical protein
VITASGSWNRAIEAAGLIPNPSAKNKGSHYADEDLLQEILRLTNELGREPTEDDMDAHGIATSTHYKRRWGTFAKAREEAYRIFGTQPPTASQ